VTLTYARDKFSRSKLSQLKVAWGEGAEAAPSLS
jgi:hypothetical protein